MNNNIGPNINAYNATGNKPLGKQEKKEDKLASSETKPSSHKAKSDSGRMPAELVAATKANLGLGADIEALVPNSLGKALGLSGLDTHIATQNAVDNASTNVAELNASTLYGLQNGIFA